MTDIEVRMVAQIIDGKKIASELSSNIATEVGKLREKTGRTPKLTCFLVGGDPASKTYVAAKRRACIKAGIEADIRTLPADISQEHLVELVEGANRDQSVDGMIVQLPLPKHINPIVVIDKIDPIKDIDGLTHENLGLLASGRAHLIPATPFGVWQMLKYAKVKTKGADVVVVGRSNLVGLPMARIMEAPNMGDSTVATCHSGTKDLARYTRNADILIVAVGKPKLITAEMVKPGAVVIDVGINRVDDSTAERGYRLVGDVDFDGVKQVASLITPVPGGVGPMTITMLLYNLVRAAKSRVSESIEDFQNLVDSESGVQPSERALVT